MRSSIHLGCVRVGGCTQRCSQESSPFSLLPLCLSLSHACCFASLPTQVSAVNFHMPTQRVLADVVRSCSKKCKKRPTDRLIYLSGAKTKHHRASPHQRFDDAKGQKRHSKQNSPTHDTIIEVKRKIADASITAASLLALHK